MLLELGFTRKDVEKDNTKTNKHWYEIHLYYDKYDMICIDCKYKYEYLCAYPFFDSFPHNLQPSKYSINCFDILNTDFFRYYDVDFGADEFYNRFNKYLSKTKPSNRFNIEKESIFIKHDIQINEKTYKDLYDLIVYNKNKFQECIFNLRNIQFKKKISNEN